MKITLGTIACVLLSTAILAPAQGQQYVISTYVGGAPPPTPVSSLNMPITQLKVAVDAAGNVYFTSFNCVFRLDRNGVGRFHGRRELGSTAPAGRERGTPGLFEEAVDGLHC